MNIDSYECLTARIGPGFTVLVEYALTSDYDDEEVQAFCVGLEKFFKEDHIIYNVNVGDLNTRSDREFPPPGELHIETDGFYWNE